MGAALVLLSACAADRNEPDPGAQPEASREDPPPVPPAEAEETEAEEDAEGEREMQGTWEVRMDADRTVRLELDGSFDVREDKADADAGETEIFIETFGTVRVTNVSDGRNTEDMGASLEVFTPIEFCPDWVRTIRGVSLGDYCSRDLVSFNIPNLDVGDSSVVSLDHKARLRSVLEEEAQPVIEGMLGDSGVIVSPDRLFVNEDLLSLNPTCSVPSGGTWITYFTENEAVSACSTG
ncbi:hypothetical protein [Ornithinimicrobium sediminis]|uniref:hypothetical protein n=1 Tax=Ornithinimicrobium sediminis TaxID=2904603 RepID=UPI001E5D06B5|nr:hypothetical protein [Ornithinimicrobium sediminis]MCE0486372.1 hypothetical protein [Ornithinimicrobium sediminis]